MNSYERRKVKDLERRINRLEHRLSSPDFRGDPGPTARELSALKWAVGRLTGQIPPAVQNEEGERTR